MAMSSAPFTALSSATHDIVARFTGMINRHALKAAEMLNRSIRENNGSSMRRQTMDLPAAMGVRWSLLEIRQFVEQQCDLDNNAMPRIEKLIGSARIFPIARSMLAVFGYRNCNKEHIPSYRLKCSPQRYPAESRNRFIDAKVTRLR
jgi:hypothetical protein